MSKPPFSSPSSITSNTQIRELRELRLSDEYKKGDERAVHEEFLKIGGPGLLTKMMVVCAWTATSIHPDWDQERAEEMAVAFRNMSKHKIGLNGSKLIKIYNHLLSQRRDTRSIVRSWEAICLAYANKTASGGTDWAVGQHNKMLIEFRTCDLANRYKQRYEDMAKYDACLREYVRQRGLQENHTKHGGFCWPTVFPVEPEQGRLDAIPSSSNNTSSSPPRDRWSSARVDRDRAVENESLEVKTSSGSRSAARITTTNEPGPPMIPGAKGVTSTNHNAAGPPRPGQNRPPPTQQIYDPTYSALTTRGELPPKPQSQQADFTPNPKITNDAPMHKMLPRNSTRSRGNDYQGIAPVERPQLSKNNTRKASYDSDSSDYESTSRHRQRTSPARRSGYGHSAHASRRAR